MECAFSVLQPAEGRGVGEEALCRAPEWQSLCSVSADVVL